MTPPSQDLAEVEPVLSVSLAASPSSAGEARRLVRDAVGARVSAAVLDTVLLLTTELISNAVTCTPDPCHLRVAIEEGGAIRVDLADTSARMPRPADLGPEAERGRGLLLLDALADAWGITPSDRGKAIWFILT